MSKNDDLVRRLREAMKFPISAGPQTIIKLLGASADAIERGAAQGVRVKPLKWQEKAGPTEWREDRVWWVAPSPAGKFIVYPEDGGFVYDSADFPSLDEAKAAAQADYEQRILSALDLATPPSPAPDAGEEPDTEELLTIAYMMGAHSAKGPTPQPPAVEAEAVNEWLQQTHDLANFRGDHKTQAIVAALEAKTDEIERLRRERDELLKSHRILNVSGSRLQSSLEAAEASNKALRERLPHVSGISLEVATNLLEAFGGDDTDMTLEFIEDGHSGAGFYAWCTEYPEDGSTFMGKASEFSPLSARALLSETGGE